MRSAPAVTPSLRWRKRKRPTGRGRFQKTCRSPTVANPAALPEYRGPTTPAALAIRAASSCSTISSIAKSVVSRGRASVPWSIHARWSNESTKRARVPVTKVLTAGIGEIDLRDIDAYRQRGGYKQWERVVRELQPVDVLNIAEKS